MKKTLLLFLIAGIIGSSQAQNGTVVKDNHVSASPAKAAMMRYKASIATEKPSVSKPAKAHHTIKAEPVGLPFMGSAANVNAARDPQQTDLTANQATGLILATHRTSFSNVGTCGTGAYNAVYSLNNGTTWDSLTVTMSCNNPTRFPNGVIFNPAGNTNPMNTYDAYMGAWNNGSTTAISWTETVYGSVQLNNSNNHEMFWTNGKPGVALQDANTTIGYVSGSDDSTIHGMGEGWTSPANNYVTWEGAVLTTGKFIGGGVDSFKWTQTVFRPHLVPAYKGFTTASPYDSLAYPLGQPGTAWSQDGKIGYVVIFGNLDSTGYNYASYQPIVYKTIDAGKTWNGPQVYNFRNCPNLTTYLYPTSDSGKKTPLWDLYTYYGGACDFDLTVDYLGNLHILGSVKSQYYTNPDSGYGLTWYRNQHGYIYDVYTTNGNSSNVASGWNARYIDSMTTYPTNIVSGTISPDWDQTSTGYVSFENRLQASRTTDGKHIFCTWEDDVTGLVPDSIYLPDIKSEAYDVVTGKAGKPSYFTTTNNNYFYRASDIALTSGTPDTTYTIPCSIVFPQVGPGSQNDGTLPINFFYLGTIQFNDSLNNASVPAIAKQGFTISQNFPNPFTNLTQFSITLANESEVSVDVFNMVGQKVYSIAPERMSVGTHLMTINGAGWNAGVYFYRVTANNSSITHKMVVQ